MGGSFFWGILLVIIGISMIIRIVFKIEIPIFRVIFAFFLIFIGIKVLIGGFRNNSSEIPENTVFNESNSSFQQNLPKEQNVIFGRNFIDLRKFDEKSLPAEMEINTIFGSGEVIIRKDMNVRIKVDAAFAGAEMPNNNTSAFGSTVYESPGFDPQKPYLLLKINVVFGSIQIKAM